HGQAGAQRFLQSGFALLERNAILQADIDAVEAAAAPEDFLGGVDIHDSQIAAEGLGHTAGFENAANSELFAAFHGVEADFVAAVEAVAIGEFVSKDEGVGLGEKDERVVNHVFIAAFEIISAQTAVAR